MRQTLTLIITKVAAGASRISRRGGGGALPGLLAEKLDPKLASRLSAQLSHGVILVTGTNGKTTTTKLIAAELEAHGERVLTNRSGSNLRRGVISSLIDASNLSGEIDATIGLFEVDEAWLRFVAADLQPDKIVVLNLFRDQLDRYGELDTLAGLIGDGIASTKAKIYLNADDPLVASLSKYAARSDLVNYFGVEGLPAKSTRRQVTPVDSDRCPVCKTELVFSRIFYSHIGHYSCPNGDFSRPQPEVSLTHVNESSDESSDFTAAITGKRYDFQLQLPGSYNLYNALAAIAVGYGHGIAIADLQTSINTTEAAFGRVERITIGNKTLLLLLIKNPAGFTQVLETFLSSKMKANILIIINDNLADGRDVSWLWDVPLEILSSTQPNIISSGIRATELTLRLKYAGIDSRSIEDLSSSLNALLDEIPDGSMGYILPTYTAMIAIRQELSKRTDVPKMKL
jgi:UDP-N-acetylmuramyl tripeptide synthase